MRRSVWTIRCHSPHAHTFGAQGSPQQRRARGEQGSQLIEFAVSAAILLTMVFGIIDLSLGLYSMHFVAEAAQQGTRFAMVRGSGCKGLVTACPAKAADIQTYVQGLSYPGIDSSLLTVNSVFAAYPAGGSCSPSSTCNNPGNLVQVKVTYAYTLAVPFMPKKTLNFSSTAVAVIAE